jgi:hypothetical protein
MAVLHARLIEREIENRRFIEFPQMKGRIIDKVEFYTTPDYHSLTLHFQDKTALTLVIDLGFLMTARFVDAATGNERVLKRWPVIHSATEKG